MSTKLILFIKCDDSIGEILQVCLSHLAGWEVIPIDIAQISFETLILQRPDAILVDVLPKTNGLGLRQELFIQKLREHSLTQSVPIVLMTDKAKWLTPKQLQAMDLKGVIAKPFDPITLPSQIAQILGWTVER